MRPENTNTSDTYTPGPRAPKHMKQTRGALRGDVNPATLRAGGFHALSQRQLATADGLCKDTGDLSDMDRRLHLTTEHRFFSKAILQFWKGNSKAHTP